jgi:type I site-specific restriction endonuclease
MPQYDGPERRARLRIDAGLNAAGWAVQDRDEINLTATRGVAIREFKMDSGFGYADYLLFVKSVQVPRQSAWSPVSGMGAPFHGSQAPS